MTTICGTERAKLYRGGAGPLVFFFSLFLVACEMPMPAAAYDPSTRRLVRLDSDTNGDGAIDHRTYLNGNEPLRAESDADGDGRVDRWEYFESARLLVVGSSSRADGVEDTWTWAVDGNGERRVDQSLLRDRGIDRREYFRSSTLVRAEADTNADGRIDRWEVFEAGNIAHVALDTTFAADRPNRRLTYDRDGRFRSIELDSDGDGSWEHVK